MKLKNWDNKDEVCECCNQVTKEAKGVTKQNLMKLFKKPSMQDLLILFILVMSLLGALAYQSEVGQYKAIVQDPQELCTLYYENVLHGNFGKDIILDFPNLELITDGT